MHALVVDDDPTVRTMVRLTLEIEGWTVDEAGDGPTGIERATSHVPDIIFLDLIMPGMSGHNVLAALIRQPSLAAVPRVVISGRDTEVDRNLAFMLGARAYLVKPLEAHSILAAVHRAAEARAEGERVGGVDADRLFVAPSDKSVRSMIRRIVRWRA